MDNPTNQQRDLVYGKLNNEQKQTYGKMNTKDKYCFFFILLNKMVPDLYWAFKFVEAYPNTGAGRLRGERQKMIFGRGLFDNELSDELKAIV